MAVVEVGALLHSSMLPLSQIHRKGRYIHPLRTGRKHDCLENRVACPLLEKIVLDTFKPSPCKDSYHIQYYT